MSEKKLRRKLRKVRSERDNYREAHEKLLTTHRSVCDHLKAVSDAADRLQRELASNRAEAASKEAIEKAHADLLAYAMHECWAITLAAERDQCVVVATCVGKVTRRFIGDTLDKAMIPLLESLVEDEHDGD